MTGKVMSMSRTRSRVIGGILGAIALVSFVIVGSALDRSTVVSGPSGSSYVTTGNGTAAFYEVLTDAGRSTTRLTSRLDSGVLETIATLVVIEPGLTAYSPSEVGAIESWTSDGGRLVIIGRPPPDLDQLTADGSQRWSIETAGGAQAFFPAGLALRTDRFGSFEPAGNVVTWIADGTSVSVTVAPRGAGWIVMMSDLGIVSNDGLDLADNARIAVSLAGDGPVGFDEVRHGFEDRETTGIIAAAPGNWPEALTIAALAIVAALVAYGRRLGPPEPTSRDLIPGRAGFIESIGDALAAAGTKTELADPIRRMARQEIRVRAGSDETDALARTAESLGITDIEFNAIYDDGESTAYEAQHALSKLHRDRREDRNE